jgi:hypothetical protein
LSSQNTNGWQVSLQATITQFWKTDAARLTAGVLVPPLPLITS